MFTLASKSTRPWFPLCLLFTIASCSESQSAAPVGAALDASANGDQPSVDAGMSNSSPSPVNTVASPRQDSGTPVDMTPDAAAPQATPSQATPSQAMPSQATAATSSTPTSAATLVASASAATPGAWRTLSTSSTAFTAVTYCNDTFYLTSSGRVSTLKGDKLDHEVNVAKDYSLDQIACGPDAVVVVGRLNKSPYQGIALRSTDGGTSWKDVTPSELGAGRLEAAIYAEGKFVLAGAPNTLFTSVDGEIWSTVTVSVPNVTFNVGNLAYGNQLYVADSGGFIYTSTNLTDWKYTAQVTSKTTSRLLYINQLFTLLGENKTFYTSPDGVTWSLVNIPNAVSVSSNLEDAIYSDGRYTLVGSTATLLGSSDGQVWEKENFSDLGVQNLYGVASGAGRRVAVGSLGVILVTP